MRSYIRKYFRTLLFLTTATLVVALIVSCKEHKKIEYRDWEAIKQEGVLRAITMQNSTSYFMYRGEEMGCEYELIKQFAESHNLSLEIVIANSYEELIELLLKGKGDIITYDMPVNLKKRELFKHCGPEMISNQVLVQRNDSTKISEIKDIVGKSIYVEKGSKYNVRIANINNEIGGGINIYNVIGDSIITTEGFIEAVANGVIDYTIADNVTATLNKSYYQNLNIGLDIGFSQRSTWLVNKEIVALADSIDAWVERNNHSKKYISTIQKYFRMSKWGNESVSPKSMAISLKNGVISPYDHLFKEYADSIGWDWLLLASMAYNETKFDSSLVSWAGAKGIMQLMPSTARHFSDEGWDMTNNRHNVAAATRYIASLNRSLRKKVEDKDERVKFILASYNSGLGHIFDAIALADKYNMNPNVWFGEVENALKLKNFPEYYNDSVCSCGYFKGKETLAYVTKVIELYEFYKQNMPEER